jgi:hypothetical protein
MKKMRSKKMFSVLLASVMLTAMTLMVPVKAARYYVGLSGASGGTAYAANQLVEALTAASSNGGIDTVYVSKGTYFLTAPLTINDYVIGGCSVNSIGDVVRTYPGAVNNDVLQMTVLDGNSLRTTLPSEKHRVAVVNSGGALDGFLIRNGHVRNGNGGGVLLKGGMVEHCIIRGNVAANVVNSASTPSKGGGVFVESGDVVNCIVTFNMDDQGLGIYGDGGNAVNNTIVRNAKFPKMIFI